MSSLNQVQIIGRLGQDPEVRYLPGGDAVCNLSVATSETWKDKASGEKREATEWHRVSIFGKLAEIAGQYLKKGSLVFCQGKLKTRKWTDQQNVERYTTEIHCNEMKMLGSKSDGQQGGGYAPPATGGQQRQAPAQQPQGQQGGFNNFDDDIPF